MRLLLLSFLLASPPVKAQDLETALRTFTEIYAVLEQEAAEPVNPKEAIFGGAIPGMLRPLDPHSVFLDPDQFEQLTKLQQSVSKGFGSVVSVLPGRVIVLQTLPGTPSARAGLAPGDQIIAINGIVLDRLDLEQLTALLEQSRRKPARLDVRRPGSERTLEFTLTPEEMQSPSVDRAFMLRSGAGYVRISSFDNETGAELRRAIEKLGGRTLKALVIDLRNNPGGLVTSAVETAALFLKPGQTIVTVSGRAMAAVEQKAPENATPYEFPVAVLVNERTASAAEIVAGCLQDHRRAVIVGTPTFGKGLVESVFPLSEGAGLALTTAYYYTPNGRSIQKPLATGQLSKPSDKGPAGGIRPDIIAGRQTPSRLQMFLEASGALTMFATEYLRRNPHPPEDFQVTPEILDQLRSFLAANRVLPGIAEWTHERTWIENHLKAEIFNQAFGVEKGEEIEAQFDPVVLAALAALEVN